MIDNRKTMDFFRPVRSTDPLVDRPPVKPGPKVIRREKATSLPPTLKESPNADRERDLFNTAKSPVYSSSVIVEESTTVLRKRPPTPSNTLAKTPAPKKPKPAPKDFDFGDGDDWFDSLKSEGFFADTEREDEEEHKKVKLDKELSKKPLYTFTGESPFLKSVKVEKRPLSRFAPVSTPKKSPLPPPPPAPKPARREKPTENEHRPSEKSGMPFWAIILITVVLGIGAGVAVFVLIS